MRTPAELRDYLLMLDAKRTVMSESGEYLVALATAHVACELAGLREALTRASDAVRADLADSLGDLGERLGAPQSFDNGETLTTNLAEYTAAQLAAGHWHKCPVGDQVRATSAEDCTLCAGTLPAAPPAAGTSCAFCDAVWPPTTACTTPTRQHSWDHPRPA